MLASGLAALLIALPAASQTEPDEPPPVYDVEIIVFEYVSGVRGSREDWAYIDTGREAAAIQHALQMAARTDSDAIDSGEEPAAPESVDPTAETDTVAVSFSRLDAADYRLGDQYQRMRSSRDYRPILHTAWRQPVLPAEQETTLQLTSVARVPDNLGGEIRLFVSRFLHLTLDLKLAGERSGTDSLIYALTEQRKMRSGELHFFDHPRYGAIALISRTDEQD